MVDFTTLHPFDFDRNLFIFLFVSFFIFSEVQFNIIHVLSRLCHGFHHWFSFPVVDGYSLFNAVRANRISYLRPFCTSVPSSLFSDRLERESLVGVQGPANSRAGIL